MKRILIRLKKILAAIVLAIMVICSVNSVTYAGIAENLSLDGKNVHNGSHYYGWTKGSGYNNNGVAYNIVIYAQIINKNYRIYYLGKGVKEGKSADVTSQGSTKHGVGVGTSRSEENILKTMTISAN